MNLTIETIKSLDVAETRKVYWDSNNTGFGIRVAPTGLKTFVFMYRFQGKCQMLTIGRFPEERLEAMFQLVKILKAALKKGEDPKSILSKESNNPLNSDNAKTTKKILSGKEISEFWEHFVCVLQTKCSGILESWGHYICVLPEEILRFRNLARPPAACSWVFA